MMVGADGRMRRAVVLAVVMGGIVGCRSARNEVAALFGSSVSWIDLTHPFDSAAIYWPTAERFELEQVSAGYTPQGYYYAANNFQAAEHGGTHLDAPIHFAEGRNTTDQIPLQRFVGPAVVVDASAYAAEDSDYRIGIADFDAFERQHGVIPGGAIVLLRTGWGMRWPDAAAYLGTSRRGPGAIPSLHFPGLHPDAAKWLVTERQIDAVGIDTPSIDYGQSTRFDTHRILFAENVPVFENVAHLEQMPVTGAFVVALPMKIKGGSGGPLRIVGVVPGG
jgi:kynurenine formamidase